MYTLSFKKFTDPDYFPNEKVVLYVIRDNDQVFYVGISKANVWYRWFGANGRMVKNIYEEWVSYDSIGNHIIRNMPKSFRWNVDLWVADETIAFLGSSNTDLKDIENEMISALWPSINSIGNSREFAGQHQGYKLKGYLEYVKNHREKIVKHSELRTASKKIDLSEIDIMELPPEDEIPF
jgi:hypothetical protein